MFCLFEKRMNSEVYSILRKWKCGIENHGNSGELSTRRSTVSTFFFNTSYVLTNASGIWDSG